MFITRHNGAKSLFTENCFILIDIRHSYYNCFNLFHKLLLNKKLFNNITKKTYLICVNFMNFFNNITH